MRASVVAAPRLPGGARPTHPCLRATTPVLHDDFRRALEAIKLRAPIEDVVRERVPGLRKAGALWVACCPFHEERTPSFKVDPRRGTWRCFGACGTGGDVIRFLERSDNLQFMDAVEILAGRTGVELPRRAAARARDAALDPLRAALDLAQRFFRDQFATPEGRASARYLEQRGLAHATGEAFGIGHAPASGQGLVQALRAAGIDLEVALRAGLVRRTDQGRPYDFFRGRLVIPIRDLSGDVVGFGARRLDDRDESGPKYVNTAETELFHKGRLIYALDRALEHVRKSGHLVLVEGYTDVMAAHQCGIGNVVAVLGTATTEDHAALIRRTGARRVTLLFDGDEAGRKAAWKGLAGLLQLDVELDVAALRGGIDPCDLLVRDGARAFLAELELARPWFDSVCDGLAELRGADLAREIERVLELLSRIGKPVHREARMLELAERTRMPVESLREQYLALPAVRAARREAPRSAQPAPAPANAPSTAQEQREARDLQLTFESIVGALLVDPALVPVARPWLDRCPDEELTRIVEALIDLREEDQAQIDENGVLTRLGDDPARARVVPLSDLARCADEEWPPHRILEEQIARLRLRDELARRRAARDALAACEARHAAADPAAAAHDPHALELARRLSAPPSLAQRNPDTQRIGASSEHNG